MADRIRKTVRFSEKTQNILNELRKVYKLNSENALLEAIIREIWEQKQSKALVPFEEFEKRDLQLQKALLEIGRLQGVLEEKEKQLQEVKQKKEGEKKKSFWVRLFGR